MATAMRLVVGSFNHNELYTLSFTPPLILHSAQSPTQTTLTEATLVVEQRHRANSGHSWLALSADGTSLYATCWGSEPPTVAAYSIKQGGGDCSYSIDLLNTRAVRNLSGYVCTSADYLFSVGGATGEVFRLQADGSIGELLQELSFLDHTRSDHEDDNFDHTDTQGKDGTKAAVPHGTFGGLRFGAHSVDLSPDGHALYVADIGRNCIWTYSVAAEDISAPEAESGHGQRHRADQSQSKQILHLRHKYISPRIHDGPRHTWPHPSGRVLYSLEEHSSMVDVFAIAEDGVSLSHQQACRIIPADKDHTHYWADEVRLSVQRDTGSPRFLYASTRGLHADTKGYVAVFALSPDGYLISETPIDIWKTPTSGGIANAIALAPCTAENGETEYLALTDSEEGWVFMLQFDGRVLQEVARTKLGVMVGGGIVQAATALWLA